MGTIYVSLLLHFYQPPWQYRDVLERIIEECYAPFVGYVLRYKPPITINANYSLFEVLATHKFSDIERRFREALSCVDVTNSAAYHPLIPLVLQLPNGQLIIEDQISINRNHLELVGAHVRGFFPPEMAIDERTISIIQEEWFIADSICFDAVNRPTIPYNYVGTFGKKCAFFRSRHWSNELTLGMPAKRDFDIEGYVRRLKDGVSKWFNGEDGYVILAFDGETLGHHVPQYRNFIEIFFNEAGILGIRIIALNQLLETFPERKRVNLAAGSWSTDMKDMDRGIYYPLWLGDNKHHRFWYHQLRNLADIYSRVDDATKREILRLTNSCIPWQISAGNMIPFKDWLKKVDGLLTHNS
ncbi:MAG: hypothetical protein N3E38_00175 [Candidatus Aenigmarchaeota archaeon]|nr:hypothetical protein [Candidatus Aenigmarchaeota archaeon]